MDQAERASHEAASAKVVSVKDGSLGEGGRRDRERRDREGSKGGEMGCVGELSSAFKAGPHRRHTNETRLEWIGGHDEKHEARSVCPGMGFVLNVRPVSASLHGLRA